MKLRVSIYTAILIFTFHSAKAQSILSATIRDASNGKPVLGASLSLGASHAVSDTSGHFNIRCGTGSLLRVSHVSYEPMVASIKDCQHAGDILLRPR